MLTSSPSIRSVADGYRRQRVAYDQIRKAFDASDDDEVGAALEASIQTAHDGLQKAAQALAILPATTDEERHDQCAVLLDAAGLTGAGTETLIRIVRQFSAS